MASSTLPITPSSSLLTLPPLPLPHPHSKLPPRPISSLRFSTLPHQQLLPSCLACQRRRKSITRRHAGVEVLAERSDIYRVIGTVVKTARDVVDAGTKLVPESVPRSLAQAGVAVVGLLVVSFVLKSIFSIALFILAIGGVSYFIFNYVKKDEGPGGSGGVADGSNSYVALEEARRIMEKYK